MASFSLLVLICATAGFVDLAAAAPSPLNDPTLHDSVIKFNRTDRDGLSWPLPNFNETGAILMHGHHCTLMVRDYEASDFTDMNLMHGKHCTRIIEQYVAFLQSTPDFTVHKTVCADVRYMTRPELMSGGSYDYYFDNNGNKPQPKDASQYGFYTWLTARNLAVLLLKEYLTPNSLTVAEIDYLQEVEKPIAIRLGSLSVFCNFGESVESVTHNLQSFANDYKTKDAIQKLQLKQH